MSKVNEEKEKPEQLDQMVVKEIRGQLDPQEITGIPVQLGKPETWVEPELREIQEETETREIKGSREKPEPPVNKETS